jgi:hypothetical protein
MSEVIPFDQELDALFKGMEKPPAEAASRAGAGPLERLPTETDTAVPPEQLDALPRPGHIYRACPDHFSVAPLPTIFFLPGNGLPDGFSYSALERVRMVEGAKPGDGPILLLRFNTSVPVEVRVEGRGVLDLCDKVGRHLVHWLRAHPTGHDEGHGEVFIRRITISEIKP